MDTHLIKLHNVNIVITHRLYLFLLQYLLTQCNHFCEEICSSYKITDTYVVPAKQSQTNQQVNNKSITSKCHKTTQMKLARQLWAT